MKTALSKPPTSFSYRSAMITFLSFFFVIMIVGLISQIDLGWADFLNASAHSHAQGIKDTSRYAVMAQYFAGLIPLNPDVYFFTFNWTPGYPAIVATWLKITGPEHYLVKMLVMCALWLATAFTFLFYVIPFPTNPRARFLTWAVLLFLPNFRCWSFQEGFSLSEPYTLVIFLFAWCFFAFGIEQESRKKLVVAGVLFAAAAYFRAVASVLMELTFYVTLAFLFCSWGILALLQKYYFLRDQKLAEHTLLLKKLLKSMAIVFAVYFVVVFPWKLRNAILSGNHVFAMGTTTDETYRVHWLTNEETADFNHTGNAACFLDPVLCNLYRNNLPATSAYAKPFTLVVMLSDPLRWYTYKLKNITWLWMGIPLHQPAEEVLDWKIRLLEGLLYLGMGIVALVRIVRKQVTLSDRSRFNLILFTAAFVFAHFAVFSIAHFEDRYAWFLRMYFFWLFLYVYSKRPTTEPPRMKGKSA